jgi:hypothetical protein
MHSLEPVVGELDVVAQIPAHKTSTGVAYVLCRIEDDASLSPSASTRTSLLALQQASIRSR